MLTAWSIGMLWLIMVMYNVPHSVGSAFTGGSAPLDLKSLNYTQLDLLAARLGLGAAIAGAVSSDLATAASASTPFTTHINRAFSRGQFFINIYGFEQTLYGGAELSLLNKNYPQVAAKYVKLWNQLKQALASGQMDNAVQNSLNKVSVMTNLVEEASRALSTSDNSGMSSSDYYGK
ncbi:hypothetical protein CEUSTIGMA_g4284.t1 [Chlamydomonas eustigma]|uniref:Uncharacterized protein n=1 Tax=Chlamydomonas eustigma TaxID=1157962 RepID=A0A250X185_9CHLO|nr:hypothetical protein CEUSTIGMA_g4284.t1 [Chlamydomonas eustigma]|eukprot:GAX76838.1 hypothetical protein CEUSTIGMA_g4284.t1 [Chlamydomonas eustigma]